MNLSVIVAPAIAALALAFAAPASAADAPAPALATLGDGQPDVQGYWAPVKQGTYSLSHPSNGGTGEVLHNRELEKQGKPIPTFPSRIIDPKDGEIPYQPWARAKQKAVEANIDHPTQQGHLDPQGRCFPDGVIRNPLWTGFEIQQFPGSVVIIFDQGHTYRIIPLDGRPHAPAPIKLWMSDSRGHWEGQTLVVDVANSNAKSRLDNIGDFSSDKVHIVERFTFGKAAIDWRATIEDPSVYTRPWTITAQYKRQHADEPDYEQWEQSCIEGERNAAESLLPATPVKKTARARQGAQHGHS
jgi:hypothetical protein